MSEPTAEKITELRELIDSLNNECDDLKAQCNDWKADALRLYEVADDALAVVSTEAWATGERGFDATDPLNLEKGMKRAIAAHDELVKKHQGEPPSGTDGHGGSNE